MANSYIEYTTAGTGTNGLGQQTFSYADIDVLNANDVKVFGQKLDGTKEELTVYARDASAKTVTLTQTPAAWGGGYIAKARVYRSTTSNALVDFVDGARLTESDLDTAYKQGLFVAQEVSEDAAGIGTTSTNNLSLSGTTTVANLTATGTVVIPSGSAATHFYREGSWTPALISGSGITFSSSEAKYRKIGTLVFIHLQCTFSGTSSNRVEISGLPFAANETTAMNIYHSGGSLPSGASFLAQTHSGHNRLSGGKSNTDMSYTDVNGTNMRISGCYVTS